MQHAFTKECQLCFYCPPKFCSMFFFIIIQKVTYLITKNTKKITKPHKKYYCVASSNTHKLVLVVPNHQCHNLNMLKVYCSLCFQFLVIACLMHLHVTIDL